MNFQKYGKEGGLFIVIGKKMFIVNNKIDFTLIKFPIIFPLIYFFILNLTTVRNLSDYIHYITSCRASFWCYVATIFNKVNKIYIRENKINLIYFPVFNFYFYFSWFFFF